MTCHVFNSGIELVGPSKRIAVGIYIQAFFTLGLILLGGIAYFIRDWQTLQIVISVPGFLFICYFWLVYGTVQQLRNRFRGPSIKRVIEGFK